MTDDEDVLPLHGSTAEQQHRHHPRQKGCPRSFDDAIHWVNVRLNRALFPRSSVTSKVNVRVPEPVL